MKLIVWGLAVCVMTTACHSDKNDDLILTSSADSLSYYIGIYTALKLKKAGHKEFDYSKFDHALKRAFVSQNSDELRFSDSIISSYFEKARAREFALTLKESEKFFAENRKKKEVFTTTSGMQYEIFKEGKGRKPTLNDSVTFHYTAITTEGVEFINSYKNNAPVRMLLKEGTAGGLEAFQMMNEGSHYRFYIPARLAYGEKSDPAGIIKPHSSIIYTIELISVTPSATDLN